MDERTFTLGLLYKSMVRPHVEFANSVWCPYKIDDSKEIEKIQKRATKLVIKLKNKDHPNIQREFSAFISALHIRNAADTGDVLSTEWLLQDDLSGNWPVYDFSVCIILVYWQVIQEAFYAVQLSGIYWQETTTATTPV